MPPQTDPDQLVAHYRRAWWDWEELTPARDFDTVSPGTRFVRRISDGMVIEVPDPDPLPPSDYDRYVQSLIDSYRQHPDHWDEVRPGPHDRWYGSRDDKFVAHRVLGVIIRRPNEGENVFGTVKEQSYKSPIELGKKYRETQTGFEGHATAIYFYQNSCERVELENYNKKQARLETYVFDAKRLELVDPVTKEATPLPDSPTPGGPDRGNPQRSAPKR